LEKVKAIFMMYFNEAIVSSDYIISNNRMNSEQGIEKDLKGSGLGLI
jgi:hypothetical protein